MATYNYSGKERKDLANFLSKQQQSQLERTEETREMLHARMRGIMSIAPKILAYSAAPGPFRPIPTVLQRAFCTAREQHFEIGLNDAHLIQSDPVGVLTRWLSTSATCSSHRMGISGWLTKVSQRPNLI